MRSRCVSMAILLSCSVSARAQTTGSLIERELDGVRQGLFQLGPTFMTPVLHVGAGYDSNALSTPIPESDIVARFGPGIGVGIPLKNRAFFEVFERVDMIWYETQTKLRNVQNLTRLGGGIGGRRALFTLSDEIKDEVGRPTTEFDFPVNMRTNTLDAGLTFGVGWRQEIKVLYNRLRTDILDDQPLPGDAVASRLSRRENHYGLELRRHLSSKTDALVEGFYQQLDFDDKSALRDATGYGVQAGLDFSTDRGSRFLNETPRLTKSSFSGQALLGYKKLVPRVADRVGYSGLIGSVNVSFGLGGGNVVRGLYTRDAIPSVLFENWYYVENRYGASVSIYLTRRFYIEPNFVLGGNDYPLPVLRENDDGVLVEETIVDRAKRYGIGFHFHIKPSWTVGVTTDYLDRESNLFLFNKDRLVVGFTMNVQP